MLIIGSKKRIIQIPIVQIRPNRSFVRNNYQVEKIKELAQSIKAHGILQPVTVRKISSSEYEMISGERRLRAAILCGKKKIPCIVMNCSDQQAELYSLSENIQRRDISYFDEAEQLHDLMLRYDIRENEAAELLGISVSDIINKLRLLTFTEEERNTMVKYELSENHAHELLRLEDKNLRRMVMSEVIAEGMNVIQTKNFITELSEARNRKKICKSRFVIKNVKIFENTILKAVNMIRSAGIEAQTNMYETDDYIEYMIRIPKKKDDREESVEMIA